MPDERDDTQHEAPHHHGRGVPPIARVLTCALSVGQLVRLEPPASALEVAGA